MRLSIIPFLLLLISSLDCMAKPCFLRGKVCDRENGEPLAFVSISFDQGRKGVITSLDGDFIIETETPVTQITVNYVGYQTESLPVTAQDYTKILKIALLKKTILIDEVIVQPGINPANRIIQKVIENRDRNNPEKMHSFSYTSYNKTYFTLEEDTTLKRKRIFLPDSLLKDKNDLRINDILKKHNVLLMENVTQRYFKYPGKNNEKIILSRVSGFNEPSIMVLSSELQSFSFYNNFVTILNKKYLNPISKGSFHKYYFQLEDTLITETSDTVFVISFHPHKKNEELVGELYINTLGYAIQNVIASPAKTQEGFNVKIEQRYELIDGQQWFPTQLNTDFMLKNFKIKTKTRELFPAGTSMTYLYDIRLDPEVINLPFTNIELQMNSDAYRKEDSRWKKYRYVPLNKKDSATYKMIDSIGKARQFDERIKLVEAFMSGYIPIGPLNFDYQRLFGYNDFEGFRLGLGLATNRNISSFFSMGGHLAYGFCDEKWKNGVYLQLFPSWASDTKLTLKYNNDVAEVGGFNFMDEENINQSEIYRDLLIDRMLYVKEKEADVSFRALEYFKLNLYVNTSVKKIPNYIFTPNANDYNGSNSLFHFTEAGIDLKFAFDEKFIKAPSGKLISMGTQYPMVYFNYRRGISSNGGEFNYEKYVLKVSKTFTTRSLGQPKLVLIAGTTTGDIPITNLFNGHGSYAGFSIDAENSFATMRMDEFYATSFAMLFFKEDIGHVFFNGPFFNPDFALVSNVGFGKLANATHHIQVTGNAQNNVSDFNKGYYESGILANGLLRGDGFVSLGLGMYYRYGPYSYPKVAKNFCYRITLNFDLK